MSDAYEYQLRLMLRKAAEETIELGSELLKLSNKKITEKGYQRVMSEYKDVKKRMNDIINHYESK